MRGLARRPKWRRMSSSAGICTGGAQRPLACVSARRRAWAVSGALPRAMSKPTGNWRCWGAVVVVHGSALVGRVEGANGLDLESNFPGAGTIQRERYSSGPGLAPVFRVKGEIRVTEGEPLDEADAPRSRRRVITDRQRKPCRELQLCFSRHWEGVGRFAPASIFMPAARSVHSPVRNDGPHGRRLGLPPIVEELTRSQRPDPGYRPTGMGKTTTSTSWST